METNKCRECKRIVKGYDNFYHRYMLCVKCVSKKEHRVPTNTEPMKRIKCQSCGKIVDDNYYNDIAKMCYKCSGYEPLGNMWRKKSN